MKLPRWANRPSLHWVVFWMAMAGALLSLVLLTLKDGPDRTVVGRITALRSHRVCVLDGDGDGEPACASEDSPARLDRFSVGDCVELGYSAEGIVESLEPNDRGCSTPTD